MSENINIPLLVIQNTHQQIKTLKAKDKKPLTLKTLIESKLEKIQEEKYLTTLYTHSGPLYALTMSRDSKYIVSGSEDGLITI